MVTTTFNDLEVSDYKRGAPGEGFCLGSAATGVVIRYFRTAGIADFVHRLGPSAYIAIAVLMYSTFLSTCGEHIHCLDQTSYQ